MLQFVCTMGRVPPEARKIREEVFIEEQKFSRDADEIDDIALHILLLDDRQPVGTARVFSEDGGDCYHIGRVAVRREWRGKGAGRALMDEAERQAKALGASSVAVDAQVRACEFYKRCGYTICGEEHLDEYCPHIGMRKAL